MPGIVQGRRKQLGKTPNPDFNGIMPMWDSVIFLADMISKMRHEKFIHSRNVYGVPIWALYYPKF